VPALHHVELWVSDPDRAGVEWEWLLGEVGWIADEPTTTPASSARSWSHADGTRLQLESGPDLVETLHDRLRPGINHLALTIDSRELLDRIRSASTEHGWHELFADRYPHAGGDDHTALYLENSEGFEVEIVLV
jgi:catechol 2,3-dioxygenase-like lactoylglutathione lyase family enzyme